MCTVCMYTLGCTLTSACSADQSCKINLGFIDGACVCMRQNERVCPSPWQHRTLPPFHTAHLSQGSEAGAHYHKRRSVLRTRSFRLALVSVSHARRCGHVHSSVLLIHESCCSCLARARRSLTRPDSFRIFGNFHSRHTRDSRQFFQRDINHPARF